MTRKELESLLARRKWTTFLENLPVGDSLWFLQSPKHIRSIKAIAYDRNSDNTGRTYRFKVDKNHIAMIITVSNGSEQ